MSEDDENKSVRESWGGGLSFSFVMHGLFFMMLLGVGISVFHKEPEPPTEVEMVFDDGHAKTTAVKSKIKSETPEPPAEKDVQAPHSPVPPTEKPPEPPPPSTPPPPPSPSSETAKERASDAKKMPVSEEKDSLTASESVKKNHEEKSAALKGPNNKTDKKPVKTPPSETKQEKAASKMAADSHSLLAAIENFRSDEKQKAPPKAHPNPTPGGTTKGGGSPDGDTRALTSGEQKKMGSSVRRCYEQDTGSRGYENFQAHLEITTDADGVVRIADFASETKAEMESNPVFRAFAERARDAVLSPICAKLPLPARMLGQEHMFKFVFRP